MLKVIVNRAAFAEALALVAGTVSKGPKLILGCVRLESAADGNMLKIGTTDLGAATIIGLSTVQVEQKGAVLVRFDELARIVKGEHAETIELREKLAPEPEPDADGKRGDRGPSSLEIYAQDMRTEIEGYPLGEYPPLPDFPAVESPTFTMRASRLREMLEGTAFAASKESSRYAFATVLVAVNGKTEFVATDGRRLVAATDPTTSNDQGDHRGLFPAKYVPHLVRALKAVRKEDPRVFVLLEKPAEGNQSERIFIGMEHCGTYSLAVSAPDGAFPPWEDVVPKEEAITVAAGRSDLRDMVKRIGATITNPESAGIRVHVQPGKGLTLSTPAAEAHYACKASGELEIGFNHKYLGEGLGHCPTEEVDIGLNAPNRPMLMRSHDWRSGREGQDWRYVLMPVTFQA